jgi:hypothetical protein
MGSIASIIPVIEAMRIKAENVKAKPKWQYLQIDRVILEEEKLMIEVSLAYNFNYY